MKEILIACIGVNIVLFFGGLALEDPRLVGLSVLSGLACWLGVYVRNKLESDK